MAKPVETLKVYETKDYDLFKIVTGNRPVMPNHVNELVKSMQEDDLHYLDPITVNKNMEIIDGQHRYYARKQLDLPVMYMMINEDVGLEEIQRLNTGNKNWNYNDILFSQCALGNKHYKLLREFMQVHDITLCTALICAHSNRTDKQGVEFKTGRFKFTNVNEAGMRIKQIKDFKQFYSGWQRRCFVLALVFIFKNPQYDHARMMTKLQYLSRRLVHCPETKDYILMLEDIYNHKQSPESKVRFM